MKKVYNAPTLKVVNIKENILAGSDPHEGENSLNSTGVSGDAALGKGSFFDDEEE